MTRAASDTATGYVSHFLFPSEIYASAAPCLIQTLLGSCVAVCVFDQRLKIGGMNHYMVPFWNGEGLASPKFGNIAIDRLFKKMESLGSCRADWLVKIFGGANQYEYKNEDLAVGRRNILLAEQTLETMHLRIAAKSVGGEQGRKIIFNTCTGEVRMKFLTGGS